MVVADGHFRRAPTVCLRVYHFGPPRTSQADYDAVAVGRMPLSQDHRDIRLVPPGAEEDEDNVTGLLKVNKAAAC